MRVITFILCICVLVSCKQVVDDNKESLHTLETTGPAKVTIKNSAGTYQLMVNNKPFYIRGAGLEFGSIKTLALHNANSFRTWRTENGQKSAIEILDEAHENGLMVTMGIQLGSERHGFNYDDKEAVQKQFERVKKEVNALKDHPALLMWMIGNELNLHYTNPEVWNAVNELSKMIHTVDPNHLTTTSLAGISKKEIDYLNDRCSDIDVLSIQMYGDLPDLPGIVKSIGWKKPYMVTEWGATGHWEVPTTKWGAPIEENSTVKAANYLKRYRDGIEADANQCIGSYVFLWGNKQERTPTWYGIFLEDGKETASVDVMHYIWNGQWPLNRAPVIKGYVLNGKTAYDNIELVPNKEYEAAIVIYDFENDSITYSWDVMPESTDLKEGGDYEERPPSIEGLLVSEPKNTIVFKAPEKGNYRLFVYATDGNNNAATANIPFKVN